MLAGGGCALDVSVKALRSPGPAGIYQDQASEVPGRAGAALEAHFNLPGDEGVLPLWQNPSPGINLASGAT